MMSRFILLVCLSLSVCSAGCSSLGFSTYPVAHFMTKQTSAVLDASPRMPAVARELSMEVLPVHYLEPGDELLIELIDGASEIRLPADQQVAADGSVDLGEFGRVIVATRTLEQAEALIQHTIAAESDADGAVNVRLIEPVLRYYVIGEVNSPGAYPLNGYESVLDGIMAAGGLTTRASACDLLLARPTEPCSCRVTLPICYRAITQLGDTTTNYQLKPGDRIFVGRQSFCEEFLPCCSQKTCDRCCDRQTACRHPHVADPVGAGFQTPPFNQIAPPPEMIGSSSDMIEASGASPQRSPETLPDVRVRPWEQPEHAGAEPAPPDSPALRDSPALPDTPALRGAKPPRDPSVPAEPSDPPRLDGELNFDDIKLLEENR